MKQPSKISPRRRLVAVLILFVVLILSGFPFLYSNREFHQQKLSRELIIALKSDQQSRALALLQQGARANVVEGSESGKKLSYGQVISGWFSRLRMSPAASDSAAYAARNHRNTLQLYYWYSLMPGISSGNIPAEAADEKLPLALMDAGAPAAAPENDWMRALNLACVFRQHHVVKRLLDAGAPVHYGNPHDLDPLMSCDVTDAAELMAHGASANDKTTDGETLLHVTSDPNMVALAVSHGVSLEAKDARGRTPIFSACMKTDVLLALIQHGANVNATDPSGYTPLMRACWVGNLEVVQALMKAGANLDVRSAGGSTPLMFAVSNYRGRERVKIVTWLLENKADVNAHDSSGNTALRILLDLQNAGQTAGLVTRTPTKTEQVLRAHGAKDVQTTIPWHETYVQ